MVFASGTYSALADMSVAFVPPTPTDLDDSALLDAQRTLAEIRRRVDAAAAAVAAEIAHRSRRELGYEGLAQRLGARTPELLVQRVTGSSSREARALVQVGVLLSPSSAPETPWLRDVAAAVADGALSLDAADAIRAGLGAPDESVTASELATAAVALLHEAAELTVERLAARARELRAELDLVRVAVRENELRERRYLHLVAQADGMTRLSGLLDPESAAIVGAAYDSATSPRRGGPRFVDPESVDRAEELLRDQRSTEQLALDAFVDLIRIASLADSSAVLGAGRPAIQLLVTDRDLRTRQGMGRIEGQSEPVSIETIERHLCDVGTVPILFDTDGQAVNVGREQRLFTRRQRIGLAARDGGCRFPRCERPPSFTEAHHIDEWHRDGGRTDLADGVLLCRHHHLLVHNNGWRITRTGGDYVAVPPSSLDLEQQPIPAPTKSATLRRLLVTAAG